MNISTMPKIVGRLIGAITLVFIASACTQKDLSPEAIIQNMHQAYSQMTSYQDSGGIESSTDLWNSKITSTTNFSIWFKRPTLLRVDWASLMNPLVPGKKWGSVLWSDGQDTYSFREYSNEIEKRKSLRNGIIAATGVSMGAANTVPFMLLPPEHRLGTSFSMLTDLQLLEEAEFEGTQCYVISGKQSGIIFKLWIGMDDFLLRISEWEVKSSKQMEKYIEEKMSKNKDEDKIPLPDTSKMPDSSVTTREIHRDIQINQPIPDNTLTFIPPEDAKLVE